MQKKKLIALLLACVCMLTLVFTGCGRNWNNSYGPITIGPNGTAYVGVFNGLISISDSEYAAPETTRGFGC